jgi:hypothetical protein
MGKKNRDGRKQQQAEKRRTEKESRMRHPGGDSDYARKMRKQGGSLKWLGNGDATPSKPPISAKDWMLQESTQTESSSMVPTLSRIRLRSGRVAPAAVINGELKFL